jgi:Tol biopolymer transport system component
MNERGDLDRMLTAWLDDPYTPPAPQYLGEVLERTRRMRQRRAWASLERWLPMTVFVPRPLAARPLRQAWLVLVALLVVGIAAGGAIVGARLLAPNNTSIPEGPAAVLAFDSGTGGRGRQAGDIYTVRADGTDLRRLTGGPEIESSPVWSPDGTRIAFRTWYEGTVSISVMDAGGGDRRTLAETSSPAARCVPFGIAWSPDGTTLVYPVSSECDKQFDLFVVAADGSSPAGRLLDGGLTGNAPAWSPDGSRIALAGTEPSGATGIYVIDVPDGGALAGGLEARRISPQRGDGEAITWATPRWSPDGTEVAAAAGTIHSCVSATAGTLDAFVLKADGSGQRTIADAKAKEYNPTWSPDGRRLAFQRIVDYTEYVNRRPCTMATWIVDADGENERRLEGLGSDDWQPSFWSPDGTRLLVNTIHMIDGREHYDLSIITADGSGPVVVIDDVDIATWQPVAAPLPTAPKFVEVSPTP